MSSNTKFLLSKCITIYFYFLNFLSSFKYLTCVVSHEILILLRNIHQVIRCDPPSFLKVITIVSTCMAMTKSDVKKYTMDLLTLSYIRNKPSSIEETSTENITNNDNGS
jgi:hypothetical protein